MIARFCQINEVRAVTDRAYSKFAITWTGSLAKAGILRRQAQARRLVQRRKYRLILASQRLRGRFATLTNRPRLRLRRNLPALEPVQVIRFVMT